MNYFKKILLLSFLLLQVFSYLHLEEHGHGGDHEHESSCDFVFHLNNFSADDSIDIAAQIPEFVRKIYAIQLNGSQISLVDRSSYHTRAPPHIS